jgi:hypothetical protein
MSDDTPVCSICAQPTVDPHDDLIDGEHVAWCPSCCPGCGDDQ